MSFILLKQDVRAGQLGEAGGVFAVNTYGTLNVIKLCRVLGAKMTYISAYVYGQPKSNPISEDAVVNPNNPYAESKYMAEELCRFFADISGWT